MGDIDFNLADRCLDAAKGQKEAMVRVHPDIPHGCVAGNYHFFGWKTGEDLPPVGMRCDCGEKQFRANPDRPILPWKGDYDVATHVASELKKEIQEVIDN